MINQYAAIYVDRAVYLYKNGKFLDSYSAEETYGMFALEEEIPFTIKYYYTPRCYSKLEKILCGDRKTYDTVEKLEELFQKYGYGYES